MLAPLAAAICQVSEHRHAATLRTTLAAPGAHARAIVGHTRRAAIAGPTRACGEAVHAACMHKPATEHTRAQNSVLHEHCMLLSASMSETARAKTRNWYSPEGGFEMGGLLVGGLEGGLLGGLLGGLEGGLLPPPPPILMSAQLL